MRLMAASVASPSTCYIRHDISGNFDSVMEELIWEKGLRTTNVFVKSSHRADTLLVCFHFATLLTMRSPLFELVWTLLIWLIYAFLLFPCRVYNGYMCTVLCELLSLHVEINTGVISADYRIVWALCIATKNEGSRAYA
jgi:hypothetical protein